MHLPSPLHIVFFLLIGLAAGFLAGLVMKRRSLGVAGSLMVGVLGAVLGGVMFRVLGLAPTNTVGELVCATVGAAGVLVLVSYLNKHVR